MEHFIRIAPLAAGLSALLTAAGALAQTGGGYDLSHHTIDGGGITRSVGDSYTLAGSAGQPDAGALTTDHYTLRGGFWPGVGAAVVSTPTVTPSRTASAGLTGTATATPTVTTTPAATATASAVLPPTATRSPTATGSTAVTATGTSHHTATPSPTPTGAPLLVVNSTGDADDGACTAAHCSLREAINAANTHAGPDTIVFNIPRTDSGCDPGGVCAIQPAELLPFLTDDATTIDGYTQPGARAGDTPVLTIVLDGRDNNTFSGLAIRSAGNVIRGLVIQRFTPFTGIDINGASAHSNRIEANFIGTDAGGTQARGNCTPAVSCGALWIKGGAHDNTVGPDNLIAFNGVGVWITDAGTVGNTITRNRIHSSAATGIALDAGGNTELAAPAITVASVTHIAGSACGGCIVEVFSDTGDEGALYEGTAIADAGGYWSLAKAGGVSGPYVTATATDAEGNTSEFSAAARVTRCAGDCDGDNKVTVDELVKGVNIALGNATLDQCALFDCNGNGHVTVDCLVKAVNAALSGCGS